MRVMDKDNPSDCATAQPFPIRIGTSEFRGKLTLSALKVSMNFSSSSGGRKSPIKCFPLPISVRDSAHSGKAQTRSLFTATVDHFTLIKTDYQASTAVSVAEARTLFHTTGLLHFHLSEMMLPGACLLVHFLITVVLMLVLSYGLLPHHLHLCHRTLVLHDQVIHLLHLCV